MGRPLVNDLVAYSRSRLTVYLVFRAEWLEEDSQDVRDMMKEWISRKLQAYKLSQQRARQAAEVCSYVVLLSRPLDLFASVPLTRVCPTIFSS